MHGTWIEMDYMLDGIGLVVWMELEEKSIKKGTADWTEINQIKCSNLQWR